MVSAWATPINSAAAREASAGLFLALSVQAASASVVRAARRALQASCSSPSTRRWSASRRRRVIVTSSSPSLIVGGPIQPHRSAIEYGDI